MTTLPRRRWLLANLLLLAAYLVTGRFGLYLSLAPGYATPLFLPAGIALAAVASRGPALRCQSCEGEGSAGDGPEDLGRG